MRRGYLAWISVAVLIVLIAPAAQAGEKKPIWLVVTRPALAEALEPLTRHRRQEGFEAIVTTQPVAEALAALDRRPGFLLLVGDDEPDKQAEAWHLPAKRMRLYRWRAPQPRTFASDAAWGDLDGDLVPEVPVGRIPARDRRQVELVVKKILAFEAEAPTQDDLGLPIWAGSPEYGPAIDTMAANMFVFMVDKNAPRWVRPWLIYGSRNHPLCGWPPDQPSLFTQQLRIGGVLAGIMGHGDADSLYSMSHAAGRIEYTAASAAATLAEGPPGPPLIFFTCSCGSFTGARPCLAESFVFFAGGPVAAIAATTESHPLTNYYSSVSVLQGLGGPDRRLGELWLKAQRRAMKMRDLIMERMLRDVEGKLEDQINVAKLRRDQALMYVLLGDPATRLRLPEKLHGRIEPFAGGWRWRVDKPQGAARLHVGFRPAMQMAAPAATDTGREQARTTFQAANAAFAFRPVASLGANQSWSGTIDKEGTLRFVATGPGRLYAAAIRLTRPAPSSPAQTKPAGAQR